MAVTIGERLSQGPSNDEEFYHRLLENFASNLRVAIPGIIHDFDPASQTASVQAAIREKIIDGDLQQSWVDLPLLLDVPIVLPRAGGYSLTMPISQGDECLIIFGDMCLDAWFSNGGVQNQIEKRRHSLSDAIAVMGLWSQPNILPNYSTSAAQLRTTDGAAYISLSGSEINLVAPTVKINGVAYTP